MLTPWLRPASLYAVVFLLHAGASADFIELPRDWGSERLGDHFSVGMYVAPNEQYPQNALPAYQKAPEGAYIAVGSERGFIGAANSPKITHLVLIDRDSGVVAYNKINVFLLKIARSRADYLQLRLHPDRIKLWIKRARKAKMEQSDALITKYAKHWWLVTRQMRRYEFADFQIPVGEKPLDKFKGVNYLHDDALFNRLQKLAREDRIAVGVVDLTDSYLMGELAGQLSRKKIPLSVFDASNAWWDAYTQGRFHQALQALEPIASDESLLLATGEKSWMLARNPWAYSAFTFKEIRSYPSPKEFSDSMPREWAARLDPRARVDGSKKVSRRCVILLLRLLGKL